MPPFPDADEGKRAAGSFMARRVFAPGDQALFASLSGDRNPVHLDPLIARRTQLGAPVVHGMHTVLWCLDALARHLPAVGAMSSLQARFPRPIYAGEPASVFLVRQAPDLIGLRVEAGDVMVATIRIGLGVSAEPADASI